MYFISYKCVVGEVGSYCQLVVTFFLVSPYQTRNNVVPQLNFDPLSGSTPVWNSDYISVQTNLGGLEAFPQEIFEN